ncbi:MAG TPA: diaminopimelate decarboxylase [Alphaproteobacteria bacterium]|nr:diaminopimelate decarboxylase [Alphaproteobacteria bacterium]
MTAFIRRAGRLACEGVPLATIAEAVGTPVYVYSQTAMENAYRALRDGFKAARPPKGFEICYAVKANPNVAVIETFARLGAGADVVSEGELRRALAAGVPPERIVFSGVGKSRDEIAFALKSKIGQINVESAPELEAIDEVATRLRKTATVVLRVNPDVDAKTHAKITTGREENKFGIDFREALALYARAAELPRVKPVGLAVHIGSQITTLGPFGAAYRRLGALVKDLRARGHAVEKLDLGGGLGIRYRDETPPAPAEYAKLVSGIAAQLDVKVVVEPGRFLVGNAGALVTRVLYVKGGRRHQFTITDAAMNDLMRPALYESWHDIVPVAAPRRHTFVTDVVGPVCETTDIFARGRRLPMLASGDLVAVLSAGAYGAAMASDYNSRPLVPEVLVKGRRYAVIRPRQTFEAMLSREQRPSWFDRRG